MHSLLCGSFSLVDRFSLPLHSHTPFPTQIPPHMVYVLLPPVKIEGEKTSDVITTQFFKNMYLLDDYLWKKVVLAKFEADFTFY